MPLCSSSKSTDQVLEAMKWYFGKRHCRSATFQLTSQGENFDLNVITSSYSEKKYLVFLDDGVAVAPTPAADQTLITVDVSAAADGNDIAVAVAAQFVTDSVEVRTEVTDSKLDIQNQFLGAITTESYTNAPNTTAAVEDAGFGGYIGQVGESELTQTTEKVQLVDDAQGTTVLDEIITGYQAEITIPLKEMTSQRWQDLVGAVAGNNVTIDGAEITGFGTKKLYDSMFSYSGRLVGHPVRNEASDLSGDITMLNTAPNLNSINFSGASVQQAEFSFISYKDANAVEEINLMARGDHTKF
jgi:hypothetical protein